MSWLFLALAIVLEVSGTTSLRVASAGRNGMYVLVVVFYVLSYAALSVTLASGMPLGVAYGIWTAVGVALTAVIGRVVFREPFTWVMGLGVVLIMAGVLLVETG
ncbi:DMT family transporter [Corynebacterium guangdongense]|uniref:Small multidrug resistance pump n=1 Tax=Corynebacterium guangdongense TaxID=1783348 RepID=A0ABU2A0K8_9CORY|nr:SMR family transporter [Corynebacterium guangdongense]MDR7330726.1 small multidrug resistance pump [Corynebacterium guangdongense]WJZ16741.1 Spermidine export protein MdtJ [Corynebacterium guangdongense]